ncbi:MAG: dihydroorotase [Bacteroidales bacterium]|nr:dihydroorotase [Bacteroidales bacterium]MCF8326648.1 dihydroorotase [Bacteroidales bacterium]
MNNSYLIKDITIVNEYSQFEGSVFIENGRINKILPQGSALTYYEYRANIIDGKGKVLLPGIIDDQVHFREPGLTHKADIDTESKAAVIGGVTSYMEMPNTKPQTITNELLEQKYKLADGRSYANYSFYLGATNDNIEEVKNLAIDKNCGIKVFMGASTGNMLVDQDEALKKIFNYAPTIVAVHCEDEETIQNNLQKAKNEYGDEIPIKMHPEIRSSEACYLSSSKAKKLAERYNAHLHILHLSTEKELELLEKGEFPEKKSITAEACVHHLWFNELDYKEKETLIKWNPAIKKESDRVALLQAVLDDRIDVIATDHAPHTLEEKQNSYLKAPSGGPLIQHSLLMMLELYHRGLLSLEKIVQKMAHNPARLFRIWHRGYIKEGYWADLVIVDHNKETKVSKESLFYKAGWSPVENYSFKSNITHTFVNGILVAHNGEIVSQPAGMRLSFDR